MRKLKTYTEFVDVTGMITDCDVVAFLGFTPDTITGAFWAENVKPLLDFCQENPEFHVEALLADAIYVNRFHEQGILFWIGEGDASPDIWYENTLYFQTLYF